MMQSEAEPQMSTRVGVVLKDRRLRVDFDIRDVSRSLRIREVYIEAIESGRFQALPAPVCALGFVRSYAELLRLDAEEIVSRYKQEFAHLRASPLRFPAPVESGAGAPTGAVLLLGAFIVIGGYAAWYVISAHRMEVAMVAPVPERLERLLEREDVQASTSSPSSHALEQEFPGPSGRGEAVGPPTSTTPPVGNASVRAGASAQATDPVTPAVKPELAGHAASAAEPASRTASGGSGGTRRMTLKANAESWVEVRIRGATMQGWRHGFFGTARCSRFLISQA